MRDARSGAAMGPRGMKSDGGWGRPPARDAGFNIRGAGGRDRDDGWSRADAADRW